MDIQDKVRREVMYKLELLVLVGIRVMEKIQDLKVQEGIQALLVMEHNLVQLVQ